ncbi:NAD-dependent dehydratase [Paucilactobacillus hokkaidonensis JCM 18461]|uniref:NAD-dependent dehydratase n=2 Tax=Paucilactobacillus hokkaidonensis TaxID=1193095 RepID=A0A0A1GRW6_9LACO|nr:NAD(P)H-binding protein [Paucilactobacillus hokkaidonensis]KRO11401.1 NAD-dependent epimerase dehydratase [Paucilactobacillus hokkaidonensis]BAP85047.1 NAD-dependent dehydratase [Paucilactobacillus hokkaidonensis JCM 18461]
MTNVLVLGAAGHIAKFARQDLLDNSDVKITDYLRRANRLQVINADRESVIEGDTTDQPTLEKALKNIDIVYANLAGSNIEQQAKSIVATMDKQQVKRLIWISTLGIYDEVPGEFGKWNHSMLDGGYLQTYGAAAKVLETSDLDYTIIRPAWLSNNDEVDYELTQKGEPFKGTEVSRKSIGVLVSRLIQKPTTEIKSSLGVNKPNTDGNKPAWY